MRVTLPVSMQNPSALQTEIALIRLLSIYLCSSVIIEENQCEMMTSTMGSLLKGVFYDSR